MADLTRPDFGEAWASEGEKLSPDSVKIKLGWVQEMMPYQFQNFLQSRQDEAILYLLQKGVPEYSPTQEYTANKSVVVYQGNLYIATSTVTGVLPTVAASWKHVSPTTGANGAVVISSGGTGATTVAEARTNLGLGTASTANLPSTNGVVVRSADNTLISRLLTGTSGNISITNPDGVAGNININVGANVAQLDKDSSWTSKGGIVLPKGSSSERGVEVPGKIRYNTELQKFEGFNGTSWNALGATSEVEITTLSGDGVMTSFTLTVPAFSETSTDVYIGGVWQSKGTYSVSGSTITFSEAPTPGTDNIQVVSRRVVDLGAANASQVSIQDTSNYYTATTVEGALREAGDKTKFIKNAILSYPDYTAASAAAATLPDGQVVDVAETLTRYDVASGALRNAHPVTPLTQIAGVVRSVQDKLGKELVSVLDFGAIGDGQYHPLSERFSTLAMAQVAYPHATSLSQSIDWAAGQAALDYAEVNNNCAVYAPSGIYVSTDGLLIPDAVLFYGDGVGAWDCIFHNRPKTWGGTNWLMYGVGAKTFATRGITSGDVSGGWRTDPDDSGRVYKLSSLMNANASGSTPATPKNLSVAVKGKNRISRHWGVRGMRFVPWIGSDGVSDYSNTATESLGAEWDIGICLLDSEYVRLENVQSVGYWREYGCLMAEPDFDEYGCLERNVIDSCKFQGLRGLSIRSADQWSILSKTSSTVEIAWSAESYWPETGVFLGFPGAFTHYSYTGITKSGDRLVFTGVSPDPLAAGLTAVRAPRRSTGASGTIISNTFIHGLDHVSGAKSEAFGLGFSTAFEASGHPLRGVRFSNIKCQTTEAVKMFLHNTEDFLFIQSQWEGPGRIIATPFNTDVVAPAPIGDTRGLQLIGCEPVSDAMFTPRSSIDLAATLFSDTLTNDTILSTKKTGRSLKLKTDSVFATALPNGNFGIGAETPGRKLHVAASSAEIARFERTGSSGTVAIEFKNTIGTQQLHLVPGESNGGALRVGTDNLCDLGSPSFRFAVVRAGTGTINTSDERDKTPLRQITEAERAAALEIKASIGAYQWLASIEQKGEGARIHWGVGAQTVGEILRSHGLDPEKYAFWCYDEWDDEYVPVMATRLVPDIDDRGMPCEIEEEYDTGEVRRVRSAGNRYGVRLDQLLAFIIAAM